MIQEIPEPKGSTLAIHQKLESSGDRSKIIYEADPRNDSLTKTENDNTSIKSLKEATVSTIQNTNNGEKVIRTI